MIEAPVRPALLDQIAAIVGDKGLIVDDQGKHPYVTDWRDSFGAAVETLPEVMEVYRMAGTLDYLLRVAVKDMAAL